MKISPDHIILHVLGDIESSFSLYKNVGELCVVPCQGLDVSLEMAKRYGKKLIPAIPLNSHKLLYNPDNLPDFIPNDIKDDVDFILDNLDQFPYVIVGLSGIETCIHWSWDHFEDYNNLLKKNQHKIIDTAIMEIGAIEKLLPSLIGNEKLALMCGELPFEREAYLYQGRLNEAPIRNHFMENNILCFLPMGAWCIFKTKEEFAVKLGKPGNHWSPLWTEDYPNRGEYPFNYYKEYITGMNLWSGIGLVNGAENHNLIKLLDVGYRGVFHWALNDPVSFKKYTTDICLDSIQ